MELVIAVTGLMRSGKDTVAKHIIEKYGYFQVNMSDCLRDELIRMGKEASKMNMSILGDQWRQQFGPDVVMRRTLENTKNFKKIIITGVRSPQEVEFLKNNTPRFKLINVEASREQRFARRAATDPQTSEEFFARDQRDITLKGLDKVQDMADYTVKNNGSEIDLFGEIDHIMNRAEYQRPSWDEYFINLANEVGKRGTCDRGRCGAVIVKNKRVLCTGYAGAPSGLAHCDEVGHLMKEITHEDGTTSKHCLRTTHAEQNAICQAARFGINLDGATVYVKFEPCFNCAKMIINAGIIRVVSFKQYRAASNTRKIFQEAGVHLDVINKELEKY